MGKVAVYGGRRERRDGLLVKGNTQRTEERDSRDKAAMGQSAEDSRLRTLHRSQPRQ
jgi:hypothetical protein